LSMEGTPLGAAVGGMDARAAPWRLRWYDSQEVDSFYLTMMRRRLMGSWLQSREPAIGSTSRYAVVCVYRSAFLGPMRPN